MSRVGLADALPGVADADLAADGAGGILDDRQAVPGGDGRDPGQVAGHAHLVHAEDGLGALGDGGLQARRVQVEGVRLDVHEDRGGAAVADAVGGGDEGVADGDDLVARLDADRQQRQVQGRGAARNRAGVGGADQGGEGLLELRDPGALADPAGAQGLGGGLDLFLADVGFGDGDHWDFHQATRRSSPSSRGTLASKPIRRRAFSTSARRRCTGLTLRAG